MQQVRVQQESSAALGAEQGDMATVIQIGLFAVQTRLAKPVAQQIALPHAGHTKTLWWSLVLEYLVELADARVGNLDQEVLQGLRQDMECRVASVKDGRGVSRVNVLRR